MAKQTASQTIGPYFSYGLTPEEYGRAGICGNVLAGADTKGEAIKIEGRVLDGEGNPVNDAMIEIWQANAGGRYNHPVDTSADIELDHTFSGFGRCATDPDGRFWFDTVKPGAVPGPGNTLQAPHISIILMARGMLLHTFTRLYFSDEESANASDTVLDSVEASRRPTLVAVRGDGPTYRFDIHLQGEDETVFFEA
jgi:protocatechuate 3,4-dioxygenase alpha subunit